MAFGNSTFTDLAGAVGDILQGQATASGLRLKAQGDLSEAKNFDLAAGYAGENADFTALSTRIKQTQLDRQITLGLGTTRADVAGSGFSMSGSALDILREGASQGALTKAVLGTQGLITEAGYQEQQQAYTSMAGAARFAAGEEENMAGQSERNGWITGAIKGAASIATLFIK